MSLESPTLDQFIRHGDLYGTELVYETAMSYLNGVELGQLAMRLRRVDPGRFRPRWRLTPQQRELLVTSLLRHECSDKTIRRYADISQPTLRKLRERLPQCSDACIHAVVGERNEQGGV